MKRKNGFKLFMCKLEGKEPVVPLKEAYDYIRVVQVNLLYLRRVLAGQVSSLEFAFNWISADNRTWHWSAYCGEERELPEEHIEYLQGLLEYCEDRPQVTASW